MFYEIGGLNAIVEKFPYAIAKPKNKTITVDSCGIPLDDYMNMMRTIEPGKSDLPWTGLVFGLTINAIWYWGTDQV